MGRKSNLLATRRTSSQHEYRDPMVATVIAQEAVF